MVKTGQPPAMKGLPMTNGKEKRRRRPSPHSDLVALNARLFLGLACGWPLMLLALFGASAPHVVPERPTVEGATKAARSLRNEFRNVLDRVDILGYGPTHPRLCVVLTAQGEQQQSKIEESISAVLENTKMERLFLIAVVVDGAPEDAAFTQRLQALQPPSEQSHAFTSNEQQHQKQPDSKVHVIFNSEEQGISAARRDGAHFCHMLDTHHQEAGLKSPEEDLMLLLLQAGAKIQTPDWLAPVTNALIVPPPMLGKNDQSTRVALKVANAVALDSAPTTWGLDLLPHTATPNADELNANNGASYPTSVWMGSALALRLETFLDLPSRQDSLSEVWPANLDLSLNLWLCADGIDVLRDVTITGGMQDNDDSVMPLTVEQSARLAAVWMDPNTSKRFFRAIRSTNQWAVTNLDWETLQSAAQQEPGFTRLDHKCRSLDWYSHNVNPDLVEALETKVLDDDDDGKMEEEEISNSEKEKPKEPNQPAVRVDAEQPKANPVVAEPPKANPVVAEPPKANPVVAEPPKANPSVAEPPKANPVVAEPIKPAAAAEVKRQVESTPAEVKTEAEPADTVKVVPAKAEAPATPAKASESTEKTADEATNKEEFAIPDRPDLKKPVTPLCTECLDIVQKAKPVDIAFVDAAGGHKEHPHMGAKDAEGNLGYVHDAKSLHENPEPFAWPDDKLQAACALRDNNYKMLQHVHVDMAGDKAASGQNRDKIFCLAYTAWVEDAKPKAHMHHERIPAIRQTWGQKCDGFMVGSTKTDPALGTVNIVHEGEEAYDNIWQKVRSMWSYVYDNYYNDYDWFHIGGDDMYLLVENLRLYLESEEIKTASNGGIYLPDGTETMQTPLFMGRRFAYQGNLDDIFISGGSGYTMNKAALKLLVVEGFPNLFPHKHTFSEDTMVAKIFQKHNVFPYPTQDAVGSERYMPFMPGHHYGYRMPADRTKDWYANYSINIKEGVDHCSEHSVAFHYVKDSDMYRLHAMLYGMCPAEPAR